MNQTHAFRQALIEAATRAPSGDNLQPWNFSWDGSDLILLRDIGRDTSLYNVRELASFVALGAALENIVIAASAFGEHASPTLFPQGETGQAVAQIRFEPGSERDVLVDAIERRCTNRKFYSKQPLPSGLLEALTSEVNRFKEIDIQWIQDETKRRRLSSIVVHGDRPLFENPLIHSHFFSCIRWTEADVQRTRDGLPIETLELGKIGSKAFRLLQSASFVRFLNPFGLSRMAGKRSGSLIRRSSAIGLISVVNISPGNFLAAGRAFQRLWLRATNQNVSLQPMTGFVLLQIRLILNETEGLGANDLNLLAATRKELNELWGLEKRIPAVMFRIGISDPPTARTVRLRQEMLSV